MIWERPHPSNAEAAEAANDAMDLGKAHVYVLVAIADRLAGIEELLAAGTTLGLEVDLAGKRLAHEVEREAQLPPPRYPSSTSTPDERSS